jgi:prolyl-tRNA synthetase
VILPIFRSEEEKAIVLDFCRRLETDLKSQMYAGQPVRVQIDTRDLRGGDKVWQHIKRGVPIRLEIGPRDVAGDSVFMARRDKSGEKTGVPRGQFVSTIGQTLAEMQSNLFERALAYRTANTRTINSADEFKAWFTPKNADAPEIHGGFALSHVSEGPETEKILGDLKVTVRCLPLKGLLPECDEPGKCIFTGQPVERRTVLAKAY